MVVEIEGPLNLGGGGFGSVGGGGDGVGGGAGGAFVIAVCHYFCWGVVDWIWLWVLLSGVDWLTD